MTVSIQIQLPMPVPKEIDADAHGSALALETELADRMADLGLPGGAHVAWTSGQSDRAVSFRVNGARLRFSPTQARRAWQATGGGLPYEGRAASEGPGNFPDAWLVDQLDVLASNGKRAERVAVLRATTALALDVILTHPECLLAGRPDPVSPPATGQRLPGIGERMENVMFSLARLGVGVLSNGPSLHELVSEAANRGASFEETAEAAFAELRSTTVEINLAPETIPTDISGPWDEAHPSVYDQAVPSNLRDEFALMERSLFAALGVRAPRLVFVPDKAVENGRMRLKINDVLGVPIVIEGKALADEIRRALETRPDWLLGIEDVEYQLARLADIFPALVEAVLGRVPLAELTWMLRALVAERIPIRDMRGILERLLQYDTVPVDPHRFLVLDTRLPIAPGTDSVPRWQRSLDFVRSGTALRNVLTHLYGEGGGVETLVRMVEIDPELERAAESIDLGPLRRVDETLEKELLAAAWRATAGLDHEDSRGVLLVRTHEARSALRKVLSSELPDLPIVVASEVRPDIAIARGPGPVAPPPPGVRRPRMQTRPRRARPKLRRRHP